MFLGGVLVILWFRYVGEGRRIWPGAVDWMYYPVRFAAALSERP